jgi:hypothetical protein
MQIQTQVFTLEASVLLVMHFVSKKLSGMVRRGQMATGQQGLAAGNTMERRSEPVIDLTDDDNEED